MIEPAELMREAIDQARAGVDKGQSPFGCAIARDGRILAAAHNRVLQDTDITAHAEILALRLACQTVGKIHLEGAWVASTCEPCPMCMAALHWARVETVFFGATIADAEAAGFNELRLRPADLLRLGESRVRLTPDLLSAECRALMDHWRQSPRRRAY